MPASGWYPDPDGTPDRYRFWDGTAWSAATTTDPRQPPPVAGAPAQQRRPTVAILIGVLALIVIVVVAAVLLIRGNTSNRITDQRFPSSSTSGWDDSSPTPTPTPTPIQSVTPTPSASPTPDGLVPCPTGDPNTRASHPSDNRVYGGNLSFPRVATFNREAPEPRMTFAHDVAQQTLEVNTDPGWIAQLAVGQLRSAEGFTGAEQAAKEFAECTVSGLMYQQYSPTRTDRQSKAITISGHPGWLIESEIRVVEPGLPFAGDHTIFLVVQDGSDWGLFFGAAPIGNAQLEAVLQSTVKALRAG